MRYIENNEQIPCIECYECERTCPKKIGIVGSFAAINSFVADGDLDLAKKMEDDLVLAKGQRRAGECIVCGRCEKACPVSIKVRDELLEISKILK